MLEAAVGALPAIFDRRAAGLPPGLERCQHPVPVVAMQATSPDLRLRLDLFEAEAANRLEVAADIGRRALCRFVRLEVKDHRKRLDDRRLALLGPAQLLLHAKPLGIGAEVGVEQGLLVARLALNLLGFLEKLDEHGDLRAQDDRVDRLEHIIYRAHRIAAQLVLRLLVHRRQEDDRNALGLVARADHPGGFVAVHARHVDIEQDDRELALQQVAQRLLARAGENDLAEILEYGCDGQQVALVIVDEEHSRGLDAETGDLLDSGWERDGDFSHWPVHPYAAASSGIG